ncbi:MAG: CBS domain-containing protein [Nitrosopumilales archaeon]|nr:CBS domain-containing protein [Nitrosopumilales archaeon]
MIIKNPDISQVMVKRSVTVKPSTTLLEARDVLFRHKIRRLVVLNEKEKPVGIITEKDIARSIYNLGTRSIKSVKVGDFMSKNLITVTKDNTIYDCAKLMRRHRISSVIVINKDGMLAGLVTKTDLVSVFLTQSTSPLKVASIMTKNVITAAPGDSLLLIESLLINHRISRVVIQRNRRPVGIITYRDFMPAKIPHWIAEFADPKELEEYRLHSVPEFSANQLNYLLPFKAVDIMAPNPITVDANDDVGLAAMLMIRNNISGLPVARKGLLLGIITKSDIVKAIAEK